MEEKRVSDEYKVVSNFYCYGKSMVTVKIGNVAHVMGQEEWHKVCRREH